MKVLAIDTALNAISACVWDSEGASPAAAETLPIERGHAEHLLPLVQRVLAQSGASEGGVDRIAVTIGPGSFTGIRIGIAAARAMGLVWNKPVVGISTLLAFAASCVGSPGNPQIASLIDARNGQVYLQLFAGTGLNLVEPRVVTVAVAVRLIGSGPVLLTGNAAPVTAIEAWTNGVKADVAGRTTTPDIVCLARLGALVNPAAAPPVPLYLNPANAKPAARSALAPAST